jgi:hypothetical protein
MNELRSANVSIPVFDSLHVESGNVASHTPKYTFIGYANLNFYQLLSENDNRILKQSSQFFQSFSKLYPNESKGIQFQVFDDLSQDFEEDIYFEGNLIGKMIGMLFIKRIPLIRQILCGVHTENGFDISSIILSNTANSNSTPSEIKKLMIDIENIMQAYGSASSSLKVNTQTSADMNAKNPYTFKDIKSTLEKSVKESCLIFNYSNSNDVLKAQEIMLGLGITILNIIESLNHDSRVICFDILMLLHNRGEFDLSAMTFNADDPYSRTRTKIAEDFISFLNKSLEFVLERLANGKFNDKESNAFVESFLSVAYFKIPKFRTFFLEAVSQGINELGDIKLDPRADTKQNPINYLIDWQNLFYDKIENLKTENEIIDREHETDAIFKKYNWKERLAKRGLALFSIIGKLEKYIQNIIVISRSITWYDIPGFKVIIEIIKHELKNRKVAEYPQALVDLLPIFINDPDIINEFMRSILYATK